MLSIDLSRLYTHHIVISDLRCPYALNRIDEKGFIMSLASECACIKDRFCLSQRAVSPRCVQPSRFYFGLQQRQRFSIGGKAFFLGLCADYARCVVRIFTPAPF